MRMGSSEPTSEAFARLLSRTYCKHSTSTRIRPICNRQMALICWRHRSKVERGHISTPCSAWLLLVQAHVHGAALPQSHQPPPIGPPERTTKQPKPCALIASPPADAERASHEAVFQHRHGCVSMAEKSNRTSGIRKPWPHGIRKPRPHGSACGALGPRRGSRPPASKLCHLVNAAAIPWVRCGGGAMAANRTAARCAASC